MIFSFITLHLAFSYLRNFSQQKIHQFFPEFSSLLKKKWELLTVDFEIVRRWFDDCSQCSKIGFNVCAIRLRESTKDWKLAMQRLTCTCRASFEERTHAVVEVDVVWMSRQWKVKKRSTRQPQSSSLTLPSNALLLILTLNRSCKSAIKMALLPCISISGFF